MSTLITVYGKQIEVGYHLIDSARPTLVFLHEGLGCLKMWRDFPMAVAEATRCNYLAYSRVGYGHSDRAELPRTERFMHDEALTMLPALLAELGVTKHILVGHSDGGSIALINGGGVRSPDLLGIITEAAHVFNEEISMRSIEKAKVAYETTSLREKLAKYHADVNNTFRGWSDIWLHPTFREWNIEEFLPRIEVPLLVIQGLDDQYGTLAQVDAIMLGAASVSGEGDQCLSTIAPEKCLIADCKHIPHHEQREITFAAMTAFIQKIVHSERA